MQPMWQEAAGQDAVDDLADHLRSQDPCIVGGVHRAQQAQHGIRDLRIHRNRFNRSQYHCGRHALGREAGQKLGDGFAAQPDIQAQQGSLGAGQRLALEGKWRHQDQVGVRTVDERPVPDESVFGALYDKRHAGLVQDRHPRDGVVDPPQRDPLHGTCQRALTRRQCIQFGNQTATIRPYRSQRRMSHGVHGSIEQESRGFCNGKGRLPQD